MSPIPHNSTQEDKILVLCQKLHDSTVNAEKELTMKEISQLLEGCNFDDVFRAQVIEELEAKDPNLAWKETSNEAANAHGKIGHEEFLRIVDKVEKAFGKTKDDTTKLQISTPKSTPKIENGEATILRANPNVKVPNLELSRTGSLDFVDLSFGTNGNNLWKRTINRLGCAVSPTLDSANSEASPIDVEAVMITVHDVTGTIFKHVNYKIEISYGNYGRSLEQFVNSVAIRRYSDFAWLCSYMIAKYPFRLIPPIPPKQLSAQADLILARERIPGLQSFLLSLIDNPVLAKDYCLRAFLVEPTSFNEWRSTSEISTREEAPIRHEEEESGDYMSRPIVNVDDQLFLDASAGLEGIAGRLKFTLNGIKTIADHYQGISNEIDLITTDVKDFERLLDEKDNSFDLAFEHMAKHSNANIALASSLKSNSQKRLAFLYSNVVGMVDLLQRLKANTFSDFQTLSQHLVSIQSDLEKVRLADSIHPTLGHISTEQVALQAKLKQTQKLYCWHHKRNDWAVSVVQGELKRLSNDLKLIPACLLELAGVLGGTKYD